MVWPGQILYRILWDLVMESRDFEKQIGLPGLIHLKKNKKPNRLIQFMHPIKFIII